MKKKKRKMIIIFVVLILLVVGFFVFKPSNDNDSLHFAKEYKLKNNDGEYADNVFVYRSIDDIIDILNHGTGIVYLGFPECPWCGEYVKHLNEVAMEKDVEKIYYRNLLLDRMGNTKKYQKLVSILSDYLQFDDEGKKKIFVPVVIAVKKGNIIGFDDETSWDTKGYKNAKEYWKHEDLEGLKNKFRKMMDDTKSNICTSGCNE